MGFKSQWAPVLNSSFCSLQPMTRTPMLVWSLWRPCVCDRATVRSLWVSMLTNEMHILARVTDHCLWRPQQEQPVLGL